MPMPAVPASSQSPEVSLSSLSVELERQGVRARLSDGGGACCVRGMTVDSREVGPGELFVCKGAAFRPAFLAEAVARGAAAYLCADDAHLAELEQAAPDIPYLAVSDIRRAMAFAAPVVYGHPDRDLSIVGITGTKGKSTVAYMLHAILEAAGTEASILGSIETDDGIERFESHNTTPEAPELWRHLRNTVDAGRRHMIMEVSSQGLKYDRVLGLPLDIGVFLNIGRDHISPVEHSDFEDYFASKLKIFDQSACAVVNLESDHVDTILKAAAQAGVKRLVTLGTAHAEADYRAERIEAHGTSIAFDVVAEGVCHSVELGMVGLFNVENALAAITCARLLCVGWDAVVAGLAHVRVPGRMEVVASPDRRIIAVVDYAHNELSFRALFSSMAHEFPGRRVIAVFGAPGGKAYERREALPRVAGDYADLLIYTEEDPAHDRVEDICAELAANTPAGVPYRVIVDREEAVATAIRDAQDHEGESLVLLLAKGDETRQHRGDSYPEVESDLSIAKRLLGAS